MGNHRAPRTLYRHRALVLGGLSIFGLAATVAAAVLVAPQPRPTVQPPLPSPLTPSLAASTPAHIHSDLEMEAESVALNAREFAAAKLVEDARQAAEAARREAKVKADVAKQAASTKSAAPSPSSTPTPSTPPPAPEPKPVEVSTPPPDPKPSTPPTEAASTPSGSYQDYALGLLGGDTSEMAALERLWGRESGWNPNAQNPTSSAYGIAQFLDSTWAATGIAKTSDPYLQIKAGLIYIKARYGSPSAAWAHSVATGWY